MKTFLLIALVIAVFFIVQRALAGPVLTPEEAARRVAAGTAVLIDVREPGEWRDGVVKGALLLPLSDLQGERQQWKPVLAANADKELIIYCRSGNRAGTAARLLAGEKFKTANAGGFSAWKSAGQPIAKP
jgi:rhodanese-related sulfurtransferase